MTWQQQYRTRVGSVTLLSSQVARGHSHPNDRLPHGVGQPSCHAHTQGDPSANLNILRA